MDKDKLIRMAIQCQLVNTSNREGVYMDSLEAFAKLVLKEAAARAAQPAPVQEPVALEAVYETIINWDEGGGKRSRRELARRIVDLYTTPPAAQRQWTDIDIDKLSVLAGFDPSHKVELGLIRSIVRTILRGKTK
jgi:hypothetical protein